MANDISNVSAKLQNILWSWQLCWFLPVGCYIRRQASLASWMPSLCCLSPIAERSFIREYPLLCATLHRHVLGRGNRVGISIHQRAVSVVRCRAGALLQVVCWFIRVAFGVDGINSYLYPASSKIRRGHPCKDIPITFTYPTTLCACSPPAGWDGNLPFSCYSRPSTRASGPINDELRSGLPGWKAFSLLLGIQIIFDLLVMTGSPLILYPVALISVWAYCSF